MATGKNPFFGDDPHIIRKSKAASALERFQYNSTSTDTKHNAGTETKCTDFKKNVHVPHHGCCLLRWGLFRHGKAADRCWTDCSNHCSQSTPAHATGTVNPSCPGRSVNIWTYETVEDQPNWRIGHPPARETVILLPTGTAA